MKFPFFHQLDAMDGGIACLQMIAKYYGKYFSLQNLRKYAYVEKDGLSLLSISHTAEKIGFRTMGVKVALQELVKEKPVPFIAHWRQSHFVVIYKITNQKVWIADPEIGLVTYTLHEFCMNWSDEKSPLQAEGFCLLLEPSAKFYADNSPSDSSPKSWLYFINYLHPHKRLVVQLLLGIVAHVLIAFCIPFLTQGLVDAGIQRQDLDFILLVLIAHLMLFFGTVTIQILRGWILLHILNRANISWISDFLRKILLMPIQFFEARNFGDIFQRLDDNQRIQNFLSHTSFEFIFSCFNLFVTIGVLFLYHIGICILFIISTLLYIAWIFLFMKRRRILEKKWFLRRAERQSTEFELIQGAQDIKLNDCVQQKRWKWENIQVKLFKIHIKNLYFEQAQHSGAVIIHQLKNILITFWVAQEVVNGQISLGMMLAIQQIIGQLDMPVTQLVQFLQNAQDAQNSAERLLEIHSQPTEEEAQKHNLKELPKTPNIIFENVNFRYNPLSSDYILENVNCIIPYGKTTAIVGASGSGKTTLLKILLKFYEVETGRVLLHKTPLSLVDSQNWRNRIGIVMQDGFIFSDTITNNIALADEIPDYSQLHYVTELANIRDFIEGLPLGFSTKIGNAGIGLSQGQKQRLLIARALYKNPDFLFFDEATSALDATNEKKITKNLAIYAQNRTVIVVAHRLSTVKNADNIIVLEKGKIVEMGNHKTLTKKHGAYYQLVKNQLELGS